jgi:hypothetical protein
MVNTTTGSADEAAHQKASIRKKVLDLLDTELEHLINTLKIKQSDVVTTLVKEKNCTN